MRITITRDELRFGLMAASLGLVIAVFVSVAGMILLQAVGFLWATSLDLSVGRGSLRIRLKRQSKGDWAALLAQYLVAAAVVYYAFAVAPGSVIAILSS